MEAVFQTKPTYHWEGDYLIPDLGSPESPIIGVWGERRQVTSSHRKPLYDGMMKGILNPHLEAIDCNAKEVFGLLTEQMAEHDRVTELPKVTN